MSQSEFEHLHQEQLLALEAAWERYRQSLADLRDRSNEILSQSTQQPILGAINQALLREKLTEIEILPPEAEVSLDKTAVIELKKTEKQEPQKPIQQGLPHAFVVMPFGRKKGPDGNWIDFDSIYQQLIKPALEEAGFESFRADEETVSGDILTDMFQELLLADLVLADLSIDNANVFYELGVRHALRKRGLVHIQCGRAYMPYDIFNVRTVPYQCDETGRPDPEHLEKDKQKIIQIARDTWESDGFLIHSPIFQLLTGLEEPDRKTLQTPLATGYWQEYKQWQQRVAIAQRQKQIGDVLLLTEEVRNRLIKEDALAEAGSALASLGNDALALKEYRQGLKLNPYNSEFRRKEAFHLSRLKQADEAIVKLENLLQDEPNNIDAICNLAHIYKDKWRKEWVKIGDEKQRLQAAYDSAYLLTKSIQTYLQAYRLDQNRFYAGINALTLSAVLDYLVERLGTDADPEEEALRQYLPTLTGAVQFCLDSAIKSNTDHNYWALVSLGDLAICTGTNSKQVTRAYKKALVLPGKSKFALSSSLEQLQLLNLLQFRSEYVQAGMAVVQAELIRYEYQEQAIATPQEQEPTKVVLFCGHMIDHPNRQQPRFPADMENEARQKIEAILDALNPSSNCLAIAPGAACGGDILFLEACLKRNMKVEVFLPFDETRFIQESINFAGDHWVTRFYAIRNHPNVTIHLQPERLGKVPEGDNAFERNNRWTLYSTLMYGIDRVQLIALWDGKGGAGRGGTADMVQQVRQLGGIVEHIDTTKFEYWKSKGKVLDFAKVSEMTS
jgi:hypothetical protein